MILTQPKLSKGTILIVSDGLASQDCLSNWLSGQGYTVQNLQNEQDEQAVLRAVQTTSPDLILLDAEMSHSVCYEVCQRLKAEAQICEIPIIFISDPSQTGNLQKIFAVGGADYISQPFQKEAILARVDHQITLLKLKQQLQDRFHIAGFHRQVMRVGNIGIG